MSNLAQDSATAAGDPATVPPTATPATGGQGKRDPLKRQQAVVAIGRRAIAPPDTFILMQDAAALLAEMLDTEASAMVKLSADGQSLRLRLALGDTEAADRGAPTCETGSSGTDSLAGYALQVAHPVVVANLVEEKRFVDLFLRKHGIRCALAVPLKLQDRSFGSLIACSASEHGFNDEDVLFAETIAHLVATTVARRQTEDSLAEERRLAAGVLQTVDALVLVLDAQGNVVRINAACERVTGFSLADIKDRPIWNVLPVAEEVGLFTGLLEDLKAGDSQVEYESYLLTKHSQRRRIAWSYSAMPVADGTLGSIIATGVDVTEWREAEDRAVRAEQAADEVRQAMASLIAETDVESDGSAAAAGTRTTPADKAQAFGRLPIPADAERRGRPRRSYPFKQRIAAVVDGKLPDPDTFSEMLCHDIAAGGFSFLSDTPPKSDMVVVGLGIPPKVSYLIAQVCHINRTTKDGKRVFLVGCNYVGRATY